ncbi:MAG: hypothetical protein GAK37_02821 [Pseudomonas sp.]|nr:MAG: hypothetical protein GAK37_02821 [Pseudomonas sp.]
MVRVVDRGTHAHLRGEVVARRQLAGGGRAEVGVVLGTPGHAHLQLVGDLVFEAEVHAAYVTLEGACVVRRQAGCLHRTHLYAVDTAKRVGIVVTRLQAILLVTVGNARRHGERVARPVHVQILGVVEGEVGLVVDQRGHVKLGGAVGAVARVDGVEGQFVVLVAAIGGAQVKAADALVFVAGAHGDGAVFVAVAVFGNGAVRVDGRHVVGAAGQQRRRVVDRGVLAESGEAVQAPFVVQADLGVGRQVVFVAPGTAPARVLHLAVGHVFVADVVGLVVQGVEAQGQEAVARQADAVPAVGGLAEAVALGVFAQLGVEAAAAVALLENDVDHTGHRVGTVLRRGAITQHFDVVDGADGDHVQVHRLRANERHAAGDVHHRRGMAALAVDQHQGLVRRQAAQGGAFWVLATGGAVVLREVERGQQLEQRLVEAGGTGLLEFFGVDHIHRRAAGERRGVAATGADSHHAVQRRGLGGGGLRLHATASGRCRLGALLDHKRTVRADLHSEAGAFERRVDGLLCRQRTVHAGRGIVAQLRGERDHLAALAADVQQHLIQRARCDVVDLPRVCGTGAKRQKQAGQRHQGKGS